MAERHALGDAVNIGGIDHGGLAKAAEALGVLVWARWRRPAWARSTLPVAVILNRLAADFLVLMPFGRRIKFNSIAKERETIRVHAFGSKQEIFENRAYGRWC